MTGWRVLALCLSLAATSGCIDSSVVLHVSPDGRGRAEITTRVYTAGLRAYDGLFPGGDDKEKPIEQELPPPDEGDVARQFGARVRVASSKLDKTSDGATRTTIVDFDDVTALRMQFPPVFGTISSGFAGIDGTTAAPIISFGFRPHENGDRMLVIKLPDDRREPDPDPRMTVFASGSAEELAFKRAIKNMAVRLYVELDDTTLLRTNSPVMRGNRATIFDLDLDRIVNNMDETKTRRAMSLGSMQEMLWQLGDMPGAVVPVEHEVFLEFEAPRAAQQQPTAPAPAAQAPPDTEIYLAPLKTANGTFEVGAPINITNNAGYDNQPSFTPDGRSILFTSMRTAANGAAAGAAQTDIYRYDIATARVTQVTRTPESEYSPTVTPSGALSVIRVELDGSSTQRLWQFSIDGADPRVILEAVKPVGYHAWADDHTLALFVLGQPATLQIADTRTGAARIVASDIGRSIQPMPGTKSPRDISFVQRERTGDAVRLVIRKLDAATGTSSVLTPAVAGGNEADTAWTPDGMLLMARGGMLYGWRAGQQEWREVASLERLSLSGVTRLAVSPKGDYLALVGSPRAPR